MASATAPSRVPTTNISMTITKDANIGLGVVMHSRSFVTSEGGEAKYLVVKKVRDILCKDGDRTLTTTADIVIPANWDAKGQLLHLPDSPGVLAPKKSKPGDTIPAGTTLAQARVLAGPATVAGLHEGDVLITANGHPIHSFNDFKAQVIGNNQVQISVRRKIRPSEVPAATKLQPVAATAAAAETSTSSEGDVVPPDPGAFAEDTVAPAAAPGQINAPAAPSAATEAPAATAAAAKTPAKPPAPPAPAKTPPAPPAPAKTPAKPPATAKTAVPAAASAPVSGTSTPAAPTTPATALRPTRGGDKTTTWKATHLSMNAGGKFILPIAVQFKRARLAWRFSTSGGDISFSHGKGAPARVNSHVAEVSGSIDIDEPQLMKLTWDNSYSWFTGKTLTYVVQLDDSYAREVQAAEDLAQDNRVAKRVQAIVRGRFGRRKAFDVRCGNYAKDVQRIYRGLVGRKKFLAEMQRQAVTAIQCVFRAQQAKKKVHIRRLEVAIYGLEIDLQRLQIEKIIVQERVEDTEKTVPVDEAYAETVRSQVEMDLDKEENEVLLDHYRGKLTDVEQDIPGIENDLEKARAELDALRAEDDVQHFFS